VPGERVIDRSELVCAIVKAGTEIVSQHQAATVVLEPAPQTRVASPTRALTELKTGDEAWLAPSELPHGDQLLLQALGLAVGRKLRLCKVGNPVIVEVRGVRVGLSSTVARHLRVGAAGPAAPPDAPGV
jgi:hypothetical protein